MARTAWSRSAARHEIDQRSRQARLQLEQLEREVFRPPEPVPPVRPAQPEFGQALYRRFSGGYAGGPAKGSMTKG